MLSSRFIELESEHMMVDMNPGASLLSAATAVAGSPLAGSNPSGALGRTAPLNLAATAAAAATDSVSDAVRAIAAPLDNGKVRSLEDIHARLVQAADIPLEAGGREALYSAVVDGTAYLAKISMSVSVASAVTGLFSTLLRNQQ